MSDVNYIDKIKIRGVTYIIRDTSMLSGNLPVPDSTDEGGMLRVVNGQWQIVDVANAEEESY